MADAASTLDLSADERRALACVLDALIPPSGDGRLPGAGEAGVASHVERVLATLPDLRAMVIEGLRDLETQARAQHERAFTALDHVERAALVAMQGFGYALIPHTYVGYYQCDAVLEAIGMEARPPHPKGYAVPENDLSLLTAVRTRGKRYRDC
jgi:hypothetical protein